MPIRPTRQSAPNEGFTLIELMIVVAIVGVLAAIAIPSFTGYVQRARMAESVSFLGEIKQRQEAYRAEFGQYADVSAGSLANYTPATMPRSGTSSSWPAASAVPNWEQLGAIPDGPTRFQYAVIAGVPGEAAPAVYNFPANEFWFVARAQADLDGDGTTVQVEALSHRSQIWISAPGGWE